MKCRDCGSELVVPYLHFYYTIRPMMRPRCPICNPCACIYCTDSLWQQNSVTIETIYAEEIIEASNDPEE